jgi:two-component system phosphate regulon sensor histidine kinase PhoR
MKRRSGFQNMFWGVMIVITTLVSISYIIISGLIREYSFNQVENSLRKQTTLIENWINREAQLDTADVALMFREMKAIYNERLTIILNDGIVFFDSDADPGLMDNHKNRPELIAARNAEWGVEQRYSNSINADMIYVAKRLTRPDGSIIFIRLAVRLNEHLMLLQGVQMSFLWAILFSALIGIIIAYWLAKKHAMRLKRLRDFAISLDDEDFRKDFTITDDFPAELAILAESMNDMAKRIRSLFKKVKGERQKLKELIEDIPQGLVVLSKKEKVYLANSKAKEVLNDSEPEKKRWESVFENPDLLEAIEEIGDSRNSIKLTIEKNGFTYDVILNYFKKTKEIIILFHDITEFVKLEESKKQFVENVSHELRTPLTAMKGFLESIEEGSPLLKKHLQIIRRNNERLIALVEDILTLSELETSESPLEREIFDLAILCEQVTDIFQQEAASKALTLKTSFPKQLYINADLFRIEGLLFNLLSNAIKYTESGTVTFQVQIDGNNAIISVKDSGIGIPEEAKERIFERFYVVDKSRSRKSGGTGLGLAIVKHTVRLHNGHIEVRDNTENEGAEFLITLPIDAEDNNDETANTPETIVQVQSNE